MIEKNFPVSLAFLIAGSSAVAAPASKIDKEFMYLQGNLEAVVAASQSGPLIDLGSGIRVDGETRFKTGIGGSVVLGKQWLRERKDEEPKYHRGEIELMSARVPRKSVTLLEPVPAEGSVKADAIFANYFYRINQSKDYRFLLGGGVGLGRVSLPNGPSISSDCDCPKGGSKTGLAYQLKAAAQREYKPNLLLQGYVSYRSFPSATFGSQPTTHYGRLNQVGVGLGFEYLFD